MPLTMPLALESGKSQESTTSKTKDINHENGNISKRFTFWRQSIANKMPSIHKARYFGYFFAAILILLGRQGWIYFPHNELIIAWRIFCLCCHAKDLVKNHRKSSNKIEQEVPTSSGEPKGGFEFATSELKYSEEDSLLNFLRSTDETDNPSASSEIQKLESNHCTQSSALAASELRERIREECDERNETDSYEMETSIYAHDIAPRWFLGSETCTFHLIYSVIVFRKILFNIEDPASLFNTFLFVIALLDFFG